jgi:hypothetical protein
VRQRGAEPLTEGRPSGGRGLGRRGCVSRFAIRETRNRGRPGVVPSEARAPSGIPDYQARAERRVKRCGGRSPVRYLRTAPVARWWLSTDRDGRFRKNDYVDFAMGYVKSTGNGSQLTVVLRGVARHFPSAICGLVGRYWRCTFLHCFACVIQRFFVKSQGLKRRKTAMKID